MSNIDIKLAYALLKQAYDEYTNAVAFEKMVKGSARKEYIRKKELVKGRVHSIFNNCPELWNYVPDYFFSPTNFDGDFDTLIEKLKRAFG